MKKSFIAFFAFFTVFSISAGETQQPLSELSAQIKGMDSTQLDKLLKEKNEAYKAGNASLEELNLIQKAKMERLVLGRWICSPIQPDGNWGDKEAEWDFKPDGTLQETLSPEREQQELRTMELWKKNMKPEDFEKIQKMAKSIHKKWRIEGSVIVIEIITENNKREEKFLLSPQKDVLEVESPSGLMDFMLIPHRPDAKFSEGLKARIEEKLVCLMKQADEDHFADNLKLPKGIKLAKPSKTLGGDWNSESDWGNAPDDSFQKQVLSAIGHGRKMAENETGSIPSLANLMSTPDGKKKLIKYLACNPEWRLYYERVGQLYATRRFRNKDGKICSQLHSYYSHSADTKFENKNGRMIQVPPREEDSYHFRFGIGLDGESWNMRGQSGTGVESIEKNGNCNFGFLTRLAAGSALIEIFDKSTFPGRQITAKTIELAEKEFKALKLPQDAISKGKKTDLLLYNGFQGGIYTVELYCNPGEFGTVYLKAFEITKGIRLSADRLAAVSNEVSGWSDNPNEMFYTQLYFTIYEGNWEQFYGARFEVWFKPDSGKPERKLFEKNFKIQGWMR